MTTEAPEKFHPLSLEQESELMHNDDSSFSRTKLYLGPLVKQALNTAKIAESEQLAVRSRILSQISVAATRFLENESETRSYTFAVYFTWYIRQEIG